MKLVFTVAGVLLVACGGESAGVPDVLEPRADGLVAHYTFDDIVDGVVAAERGRRGTCTRCPATVAGKFDTALAFDGAAELVLVDGWPALDQMTQFTVTMWLRHPAVPAETGCVVNKLVVADDVVDRWQLCDGDANRQVFSCFEGAAPVCVFVGGVSPMQDWTLATLWYDGVEGRVYIGANRVTSSAVALPAMTEEEVLAIGSDLDHGAPHAFWTGEIDDLKIWNRALSESEIQAEAAL
ncbi:MAG TPA: LamG-like jellyroll fold domain-containing protein [Kofleriaceae bacterium]|jgi:hypothetical protein